MQSILEIIIIIAVILIYFCIKDSIENHYRILKKKENESQKQKENNLYENMLLSDLE